MSFIIIKFCTNKQINLRNFSIINSNKNNSIIKKNNNKINFKK